MTLAPPEEPKAQIIDIMEALKASLADGGEEAPKAAKKTAKRKAAKAGARKTKAKRKPPKRAPREKAAKKVRAVAAGGKKRKTTARK